MEKVWINKGEPKKVIEKDDVHYFYWPIEIGVGKIRIFGREIPLPLPIKLPDYEPIKVLQIDGKTQVLSRFHYKILTYFNNPMIIRNKPVVDFSLGSHSPYVHSKTESRLGANVAIERLDAIEASFVQALIMVYWKIVSGRMRIEPEDIRDYEVKKGEVPEEALFEPSKCHSVVWVGMHPEKKETPSEVWKVLIGFAQ